MKQMMLLYLCNIKRACERKRFGKNANLLSLTDDIDTAHTQRLCRDSEELGQREGNK